MKIGVCTGLKNISAAAEAGFDYIEPSLTSLEKMTDAEFAYAASLPRPIPVLRANGLLPGELKVTGPSVDFGAIRAYLDLAFARASKLGIGIAVFGSGKARAVPEDFPFSEAWLQLSSFLSVAAEYGEKYSVSVAIEPLRRQECNILNLVSEAVALAAFTGKERIGVGKTALKRTSLYASGASPVNLLQARFYHEDCLVYDLEDSVPLAEKDAARLLAEQTMSCIFRVICFWFMPSHTEVPAILRAWIERLAVGSTPQASKEAKLFPRSS